MSQIKMVYQIKVIQESVLNKVIDVFKNASQLVVHHLEITD